MGAVYNQIKIIKNIISSDDTIMLIDGDDCLMPNPNIFSYISSVYAQGVEFTYGSCWSSIDGIPLIAQTYPKHIRETKSYREQKNGYQLHPKCWNEIEKNVSFFRIRT